MTICTTAVGESICNKLLSNNNHLLCISRKKNNELISLANSKNCKLDYFEFDLYNTNEIEELMKNIFDKIDSSVIESLYLINNAGVYFSQNIEETEPNSIIKMMNVNLISPMILTSCFIKKSEKYNIEKRILNVSSGASFNLSSGGSCYSTSKAGLETFSKSIGIEKSNVKIMAIRPGMVDTYMHRNTVNKKNLKTPEYAAIEYLLFYLKDLNTEKQ
ncbi:SDR family NAD(P)-dependent oxidoreductase [Bacillus sp. ISL-40]|uniref:SDR family NAD(P)-dependent oxidoreductase n=1 Tax=unclassified Bacillus (in: firmicutes) TaxID=185979 RepID=UPI001BEB9EAB|nr:MULTISPECIES: SDR family NAD(P)-dependent oxidoreductase [unclassified Bacillus (in: firmicutes)]MBT2700274.1 SDR family NAD(P)-dependent oxidoreductase [Bacillus sp. ISL-40]MBT2724751.1 SDR family NAD(P)-dependent oxidoreductase [Bacillus sp. ISL-46]MBT2740137.1 SDR family NAD(P)-dependent oxidoreductase [Bacillus sp. ISL-77]